MPGVWERVVAEYGRQISPSYHQELDILTSDPLRADRLDAIIIDISTYNTGDKSLYLVLRAYFVNEPRYVELLPNWLKAHREASSLRRFMQQEGRGYQERRELIQKDLAPLHEACERGVAGTSPTYDQDLFRGYESVEIHWRKAQNRLEHDSAGAITAARSMLESLFKHILDQQGTSYTSSEDIISLYRKVQSLVGLLPAEAPTDSLRQFMAGCASIVNGIASLRNASGDAHGRGQDMPIVPRYVAELQVDMAGTLARFLVEYMRDRPSRSSIS